MLQWFALISYALICIFTPGPNNIMALAMGHQVGWRRTLPFSSGVFVGFLLVLWAGCAANLVLAAVLPRLTLVMQVIGAAYMLFLAWKMVRAADQAEKEEGSTGVPFAAAVALQFANPKGVLFALTATGSYLIPLAGSAAWAVCVPLSALCLGSTLCWAFFGDVLRRFLHRHRRPFYWAMAILLALCAVSLFL